MAYALASYCYHVSVGIDEVLDLIGYSPSDRGRRIKCSTMTEVLNNLFSRSYTIYTFGSRSDGSTMYALKSDSDSLYQEHKYNAVTDVSECVARKLNLLMVQDDDTHPGYAKLQYIDVTRPHHPVPVRNCCFKDSALDGTQRSVLPNAFLHLPLTAQGKHKNGPASTELCEDVEYTFDTVHAIRCYRWPTKEVCFFTRRRVHGWPTAEQLRHIKTYGCFLVPVGHPSSHEEHLEWRLCFSIGERDLTRSLNETMMKVLVLLKIFKKTFIKPVIGDTFTSYHCKVCLFWVRERTCEQIWRRENILFCLSICLDQILVWAKSGYCPDYFNARNNIYDRKIIGTVRLDLIRVLETMKCSNFEYLRCIQLGNIGSLLFLRMTFGCLQPINWLPQDTVKGVFEDYATFCSSYKTLHTDMQEKGWIAIYRTIKAVSSATRIAPPIIRDALNCSIPAMYAHLTYQLASLFIASRCNMEVERMSIILDMMSRFIIRGLDCDSVSCRLKIAGFFYQIERFAFTEICLKWAIDRLNNYVFNIQLFRKGGESTDYDMTTIEIIFSTIPDLKTFFRDYVALSVVYSLSEIPITPAPIRLEMFRTLFVHPELVNHKTFREDKYRAQVDSPVFAHFLLYLCHDRQGRNRSKLVDIQNLIYVIKTDLNKDKRETSFNLLGYCLMQEGMFVEAYACLKRSWCIFPHVNACKFWMTILLLKVYNMRRRCHRIT